MDDKSWNSRERERKLHRNSIVLTAVFTLYPFSTVKENLYFFQHPSLKIIPSKNTENPLERVLFDAEAKARFWSCLDIQNNWRAKRVTKKYRKDERENGY